jgi:hypothetical protein
MNNFHYHQDPLYAAASSVMRGETQDNNTLDEAIDWNIIQSMYVKDIIDIVAALVIGGGIGIAALLTQRLRNYLSDKADERDAKANAQLLKDTLNKILKDSKSKELIAQIKSFPYSSKSTEEAKKNNEERKKLVRAYSARLKTLLSDDEYALIHDIYNNTIRESMETLEEGVEDVKTIISTLKVGDLTNFGKVLEIGPNSITFKAKDLPKTTIAFNQRKMGSSEFLLLKTIKLKEETESLEEAPVSDIKWKVGFSFADPWGDGIANSTITIRANDAATAKRYAESDLRKKGYSKDLKIKSATKITEGAESLEEETDYTRFKQLATLGLVDAGELPKIITAMKAVEAGKEISAAQKDLITSTFMALIGVVTGDTSTLNKLKQSLKGVTEGYKTLRAGELIDQLQSIIDAPDAKLWDVTSVSIRLTHNEIFERFPKIYPFVKDMWAAIMTDNGARKTKEIAKKAIEAVHKYYPDKDKYQRNNPVFTEEVELEEEINWLGGYLATSEKGMGGGYRPHIIDKATKKTIYLSSVKYNTPEEAKDHAEEFLKQKSKGVKNPNVPKVGTFKESDCSDETMDEAADAALKRRKQVDMARVNAGTMSRDDYNKKYKLGKYRTGSSLAGPGGLYKNLVKKEETAVEENAESLEEAVPTAAVQKLITSIDMLSPKEYLLFLQALASNAWGVANMSRDVDGQSNAKAWKTVADHIEAAADAYAKRPVRMEGAEVQGETL